MAVNGGARKRQDRRNDVWRLVAALLLVACGREGDDGDCTGQIGRACTWAGTTTPGYNGEGLDRRMSRLYWPVDLEFAPDGKPYVLDWNNHRVRRVEDDQTFTTVIGKFIGDGPADQSDLSEHGAHGETVSLNHPTDIQFDADGTMYLAAWHNHKIRTWSSADDAVHVMCGRGAGFAGDGSDNLETVRFSQPKSIVLGPDHALYVLDQRNQRVRKLGLGETVEVSTVVGSGSAGFATDEATATTATLNFETGGNPEPSGALAMDGEGRLYISDGLNHRIRRVDLASDTIETIAGTGEAGYSGDGGPAALAAINNVRDLELGPDGRLYLADTENHRVRAIDLASGMIETVVGTGETSAPEAHGSARSMALNRPFGIAFDAAGDLYVADTNNHRILKVEMAHEL